MEGEEQGTPGSSGVWLLALFLLFPWASITGLHWPLGVPWLCCPGKIVPKLCFIGKFVRSQDEEWIQGSVLASCLCSLPRLRLMEHVRPPLRVMLDYGL